MATGYVKADAGDVIDVDAAITAWELETGVTDCVSIGGIGAQGSVVKDEISNGIVKLEVTAATAGNITDGFVADAVIVGVDFSQADGEAAPA